MGMGIGRGVFISGRRGVSPVALGRAAALPRPIAQSAAEFVPTNLDLFSEIDSLSSSVRKIDQAMVLVEFLFQKFMGFR
jgi:hypothetical protein